MSEPGSGKPDVAGVKGDSGDGGHEPSPAPVVPPAAHQDEEAPSETQELPTRTTAPGIVMPPPQSPEPEEVTPQRTEVPPVAREEYTPAGLDDGCEFILQFNCARVFMLGYSFAFDFLITAKGPAAHECENVGITLEFAHREPITQSIAGLGVSGSREVSLYFEPRKAGIRLPATAFLTYTKGGEKKRFEADVRWNCFPPDEPVASVIDHITIDLRDVEARGAADQNIRILENFGATHPESTAKQLRQLDLMPVWKPLELVRVNGGHAAHLPPPPSEAIADRLTLHLGDLRVHLLCGDELTLGKNWRNDIATHVFKSENEVDEELTGRVSRFHARLQRCRGGCRLVDGGYDPQNGRGRGSAYGTYGEGRLLGKLQSVQLRTGSHATLGLARHPESGSPCLGLDAYAWSCDAVGRRRCAIPLESCRKEGPSCLVLKRRDGLRDREVFVVVWKCCPLVLVDEAFGDMTVWRHDQNEAFGATCGTSHFWLSEGASTTVNGQEIVVGDLEQMKLERYAERRRKNGRSDG